VRTVHKTSSVAHTKALTDSDVPGAFEALVSVFGNVDNDGDIVAPGAFAQTLAEDPKPIVWSHDWMLPPIGETLEASETADGLLVKGRLFVADGEDHAVARQVYAGMKAGALREFSWGGRVTEETRREEDDGRVVWVLNEIDLVEYGPCLKGANSETRLVAVKALDDAAKNILDVEDLARLRVVLGLHAETSTADTLAALRLVNQTSPPRGGATPEQRLGIAEALLP
jgi:HK97 family phage prohead protease